ncbi:hypothetical protein [Streptomyces sp. PKU-MA01144]|uniref:hypothetical protein n=1 Tax=Streptomyces sp. PKU-MA01144 TaxID=2729138 RepID=UPI002810A1C1|nr:hypothetical protein [Streptomyces sp. PKU-MA01144]
MTVAYEPLAFTVITWVASPTLTGTGKSGATGVAACRSFCVTPSWAREVSVAEALPGASADVEADALAEADTEAEAEAEADGGGLTDADATVPSCVAPGAADTADPAESASGDP